MPEQPTKPEYIRAEDFFTSAEPTTIAQDVRDRVLSNRREEVLDMSVVRRQEDWSLLAHRTVGAEAS